MKKKVVIIEDSPTDASIMKWALEGAGLEVSVATCGEDGMKLVQQKRPDLVILDLILPDISGYDICRRIRADEELKNMIVLIVSIKDQFPEIAKAIHVGANDYVIKPSTPELLVKNVKLHLGIS